MPASRRLSDPLGVFDWAFWLLLFGFELFLFTMPLFPNGDGPVHIYLSTVFWKVATHSSPLYEHFYAVRHLVQPYSFHYYLLILLGHVMSADMAEKCFIGLIWATQALGFRSLARALGQCSYKHSSERGFFLGKCPIAANPSLSTNMRTATASSSAAALIVFPLLLSWPLSAGFLNFTFGTGLLLCALAFYTRLASDGGRLQFAGLLLTLVLLVLAHPIPLMILIFLMGVDLGLQLAAGWQNARRLRLPTSQTAGLALACLAFVFPILIADKSTVASSVHQLHPHLHLLLPLLLGYHVSCFHVRNIFGWSYQTLIVAMLPLSVVLFVRAGLFRRVTSGLENSGDRLLLCTLLYLAATLFFPDDMNGSALFAVRMWYVVWLLTSVCVAAALGTRLMQRGVATFGAGLGLVSLLFGVLYLRPIARQGAELERAPLPAHARGLFLEPTDAMSGVPTHTWWGINWWDGVRAFAVHDDVLVNTPWMQLTIVPVQENRRAGLLRDVTPNLYSESPSFVVDSLEKHRKQEPAALGLADFLLFADPNSAHPNPVGLAAAFLGTAEEGWSCTARDFYAVCTRKPS